MFIFMISPSFLHRKHPSSMFWIWYHDLDKAVFELEPCPFIVLCGYTLTFQDLVLPPDKDATCICLFLPTLLPDFRGGLLANHRPCVLSSIPQILLLENVWDALHHKVRLLKVMAIKRHRSISQHLKARVSLWETSLAKYPVWHGAH